MENVVILGSGIAGWTAAIYAARANLSPLVIAGAEQGGQLTLTTTVENYPGYPEGIEGPKLVEKMRKQAEKFGARLKDATATKMKKTSGGYEITLENEKIKSKVVIVATGASARMLGLDSEKKYLGKGVSTCATCDAYFFKDKEVIVVGGGDGACEEALFITKFAKSVTIVHRRDKLRASKIMQDRVFKNDKINIIWDSVVEDIIGDGKKVTAIKLKNLKDNSSSEKKVDGVFLAVGHVPNTKIFDGVLDLDAKGYLKIDRRMKTNLPGVFAAGDVCDYIYKQAVTAAGMGCQAAIEAEKYLESLNE
jgi:thioredoxin reductase (NADPH)